MASLEDIKHSILLDRVVDILNRTPDGQPIASEDRDGWKECVTELCEMAETHGDNWTHRRWTLVLDIDKGRLLVRHYDAKGAE